MAFRICQIGRDEYLYCEDGRLVSLYVEGHMGDTFCVAIYASSLARWMAPHHLELISDEHREIILERLTRRFQKQKTASVIERDAALEKRARDEVLAWRERPSEVPPYVLDEASEPLKTISFLLWTAVVGAFILGAVVRVRIGALWPALAAICILAWALFELMPFLIRR